VLQGISLDVPSRGFVALVGHTGSGKSTLASLLMGYYPLTQGEIRLDGRPLVSLSHNVLRKGVAMVQQDPVVMADTFYANVTLGRPYTHEQVWEVLEKVQLADLAREFSDGINTRLGEQGNNLSVGQKQLLALARVLIETPQVLILDEATASIDSGTEQAIQQALAAVRDHTTLVVIAHRLSTIVEADTILVLHRGQAVERGTHRELLEAKGATGRCTSCNWPEKSWPPARAKKSRLAPDAPKSGNALTVITVGAKRKRTMHCHGAFFPL
jgi:ATP-binding cassette subfamily B multidrug efflux pump